MHHWFTGQEQTKKMTNTDSIKNRRRGELKRNMHHWFTGQEQTKKMTNTDS
jgi:hypothetical protein